MKGKYRLGVRAMSGIPKLLTLTLLKDSVTGKLVNHELSDLWQMKNRFFHVLRKRINSHTGEPYKILSWCGCIEPPNHIHIVYEGDYLPQHELSEVWADITGDSYVVDIRGTPNGMSRDRAANYVTKYITKTKEWESAGYQLDDLKSLRVCQSWGLPTCESEGESICPCGTKNLHPTYTSEYYDTLPVVEFGQNC